MTVTGQNGSFMVGPQTAKGAVATTLYKYKTYDVDFGIVDDVRQVPLEVLGVLTPTGAFKAGSFVAGGARLTPRLQDDIGWLFFAALGSSSSVANYGGDTGVYAHVFRFATDEASIPWVSVWKHIPGAPDEVKSNDGGLLVKGLDCKVMNLDITIPAASLIAAQIGFVGRVPSMLEDPNLSGLGVQAYDESTDSLAVSVNGHLKFDGSEIPVTQARVSFRNGLTTPQEEMIVGSPHPDDFIPRTRSAEVSFVYKWENADLYQKIITGSVSGTAWSPIPTYAAFEAQVESPDVMGATNTPYTLIIQADNVGWRLDGEPQLQAGGIIAQRYIGTVQENVGGDYVRAIVLNETASYTWPT